MSIFSRYRVDINNAYKNLDTYDSKLIETKFGTMQYSVHEGEGTPVLIVHGIVGGFDQALETGFSLMGRDSKIVAVSRFGYLKSDLPKNPSPENQSKVYAEILDYLGIDEVILLATSAGGTPCMKFALMYPDRVKGIILVGSGAPSDKKQKGPTGPPRFIYSDFIFWLLLNKFRPMMRNMFGVSEEEFDLADEKDKDGLDRLFKVILPIKPRRPGISMDERITNPDMIRNYDDYRVEDLQCPFLILHAKNDPMAKIVGMKLLVDRLQDVEFIEYENGGHVLFGHGSRNVEVIKDFVVRICS